jgi:hypothetical protein
MRTFVGCTTLETVLLLCLLSPVRARAGDQFCSPDCGTVAGKVGETVRSSFTPMPGVRLVFTSQQWSRYETRTDSSGRYELKLPYGAYWIEVLKDGSCPAQRPVFKISPAQSLSFDFELVACPSDAKQPSSAYPYREQAIPGDKRLSRPEVRVASGEHISTGTLDIYKSFTPKYADIPFRVTVMADEYTVRAREVTLNRNEMTFFAEGDVEVSDGEKVHHAKTARLSFLAGKFNVETER